MFFFRTRRCGRIVPGSAQQAASARYPGRHSGPVPLSAPYLLRSMQIIADRLLLVSFYRTASQLRYTYWI